MTQNYFERQVAQRRSLSSYFDHVAQKHCLSSNFERKVASYQARAVLSNAQGLRSSLEQCFRGAKWLQCSE